MTTPLWGPDFNKQKDIIAVDVGPTLHVHSQKICSLKSKAAPNMLLLRVDIQEHCWYLQLKHLAVLTKSPM